MSGYPRNIVFFDLESTGLGTSVCEITQLSAICGQGVYNAYILPRCSITEEASRLTGLTVYKGHLLLNGVAVATVPLQQALSNFINFLWQFNRPLLAAHNAKRFDCVILARLLQEFSLWGNFQQVVSGFLDTLLISKTIYPQLSNHSQEYLVQYFLGKSYNAHNALDDVNALQELFYAWKLHGDISYHVFQLS